MRAAASVAHVFAWERTLRATGISGKQPSMMQDARTVIHDRPFEAARDTTGIA
jgi:hypothetical protein